MLCTDQTYPCEHEFIACDHDVDFHLLRTHVLFQTPNTITPIIEGGRAGSPGGRWRGGWVDMRCLHRRAASVGRWSRRIDRIDFFFGRLCFRFRLRSAPPECSEELFDFFGQFNRIAVAQPEFVVCSFRDVVDSSSVDLDDVLLFVEDGNNDASSKDFVSG